jgi:hypothetical protein
VVVVELITPDGSATVLGPVPAIVDATDVMLAVHGAGLRSFRLDGIQRQLSASDPGLLSIDLRRSTGFHRGEVDGQTFWFGSTDHKLRLDGLAELLNALRGLGTAWSGQVMFSDGALLRDPHVVYGWLDDHAGISLAALERIARAPVGGTTSDRRLTRRGSAHVDVRRTLKLLRVRGSEYLEKDPSGALDVEGERYTPLRVVERTRKRTQETPWHRRSAAFAHLLGLLADEVLSSDVSAEAALRCQEWRARSQEVERCLPVSTPIGPLVAAAMCEARSGPELTDDLYMTAAVEADSLFDGFGWQASDRPLHRYAYVAYADAIYQVYAAHVLAEAFGLVPTHPTFGTLQPVFIGDGIELYHDTPPPEDVLRSWRASSDTPDASKPDLLLHEPATDRVLVIDAKYRASGNRATEDSRKEVASYMALYGVRTAGIAFPPASLQASPTMVEALGNRLLELPIKPGMDFSEMRALLERLFVSSPY